MAPLGARRSKYGSQWTEVDGIKFQSKREAKAWSGLRLAERVGEIRDLKRQVPFILHAAGGKIVGKYMADFTFYEQAEDRTAWLFVVADAKGMPTDVYVWKKRHMMAEYGIEIREI